MTTGRWVAWDGARGQALMDRAIRPLLRDRIGPHRPPMAGHAEGSEGRANASGAVAHLHVTRLLRADPAGLCRALSEPGWLGRILDDPGPKPGRRRVETDLTFALSDDPRTLTFRKAALVELEAVAEPDGTCSGIVEWRAATLAPLFPLFAGTVRVHEGGLVLEGGYAPPGGGVGLLVDRAILHHFAERTAIWFLDRLMDELAGARG